MIYIKLATVQSISQIYTLLLEMKISTNYLKIKCSTFVSPEGWYGEGGRRRAQGGAHMYTCGGFILIFGKTNTIM